MADPDFTSDLEYGIWRLARQTSEEIHSEENGVIRDLLDEYGERQAIWDYTAWFGPRKLVRLVTETWHRRFGQAMQLVYEPKSQTSILCVFGSVVDLVYTLDQASLDRLEEWCLKHSLNDPSRASSNPRVDIRIPSDIIDALELAFQSSGLKPAVQSYELRRELRANFPLPDPQRVLGGAPAIMAETLAQLGIRVRFYSLYHSSEQADCFDPGLGTEWLDLSGGGSQYLRASDGGQPGHPTRHTYALAYPEGLMLKSRAVRARKTDRTLLILRPYYGKKTWSSYSVDGQPVDLLPGTPPAAPEWPSVSGFVVWRVIGDDLKIAFVPDAAVQGLAREHHYVILNAPGLAQLQDPAGPLNAALLRQLRAMSRAGASVHLEISGAADPARHQIMPFAHSLRGVVRSMGINHEELAHIAGLPDYAPGIPSLAEPGSCDVYQRYVQALRLALVLDLERLYVHADDVDFVLRRWASEAALQQEVQAVLFTKGAAIVSMLLRNNRDVRSYSLPRALYHKGFCALIEFAWQFSKAQHPNDETQRNGLFRQIASDGYYLARGAHEYSVAVAPVMWPEEVRVEADLNTTGLGDICSVTCLIYSGWCASGLAARRRK